MLADIKNQEAKNVQTTMNFILQLMQLGYKGADLDKMVAEMLQFAEIDPKRILSNDENSTEEVKQMRSLYEKLVASQTQNAAPPQSMVSPTNTGVTLPQQGGLGITANNAQAVTDGTV